MNPYVWKNIKYDKFLQTTNHIIAKLKLFLCINKKEEKKKFYAFRTSFNRIALFYREINWNDVHEALSRDLFGKTDEEIEQNDTNLANIFHI